MPQSGQAETRSALSGPESPVKQLLIMRILPIVFVFSLTVFFLVASPVYATVFQYFDDEGTLIVTDNPFRIKKPGLRYDSRYRDLKLAYRDDVSYDYYIVSGTSFQDAIAATKINGPVDRRENKTYAGETKWNFGWTYKFDSSHRTDGNSVYVSLNIFDIEFRSDIVVLMPMLSDNASLQYHDLKSWEGFLQGLLEHEHDHVNIIKDPSYRDEARRKIMAVSDLVIPYDTASNIDELIRNKVEQETAKIGHELIMKIKARNDEYDRLTDHGMKHDMREVFFR